VNARLQRLFDARDGVLTWAEACSVVPVHRVEYACRSGQARRVHRGVLLDTARRLDMLRRLRAALAYAGPEAALSHTSALWLWRLPVSTLGDVHITTGPGRRLRTAGIVAHRRAGFQVTPPEVVVRGGLRVTRLERTLADAWPLLSDDAQRAPLLRAVADRMTTVDRVRSALDQVRSLPQRAGLADLLEKVSAGCRSPLELWGYEHVFTGPGMERLRFQVPVPLGARTVWLDVFDEESLTNFELDGAKYHSSPADRERDLRRDAALATISIQVVRFSHERLTRRVVEVRREVLAIMAARRRWALDGKNRGRFAVGRPPT